jgi:hypothetical protein
VHRVKILLLGLASALSTPGCSGESCTEVGCTSSGFISGSMTAPGGTVTVEACRNGACTRLENTAAEGCRSAGTAPQIQVCFTSASTGVEIGVTVYEGVDAPALADGDVYTLDVTDDASGVALVDFTGTASYEDYRPNGAGCEPVCKNAELEI